MTKYTAEQEVMNLALALDRFISAAEIYHSNPWDRVNIRKYSQAKDDAIELLREQGLRAREDQ